MSSSLRSLAARLKRQQENSEAFTADLVHELKNPLATVRSTLEALEQSRDASDRQRLAETANEHLARMERMLSASAEIARIETGAERLDAGGFDLAELAKTLCSNWRRHRFANLKLELGAKEPCVVSGSADDAAQAIENLLANATGLSPEDGAILVTLTRDRHHVRLRVSDQGPGIPPEHAEAIFRRFFTYRPNEAFGQEKERPGPHADRTVPSHLGLGLPIARALCEAMGGELTLIPSDRGAVFELSLPLADLS